MKIYDEFIKNILELLKKYNGKQLNCSKVESEWPDAGNYNMVMRSDMAYELGGSFLPAITSIAFTSSEELVDKDEVILYGSDIPDIKEDSPYARLTFIKVAEDGLGKGDEAYSTIRKIEYTRYHLNPKGYMMRISSANERENVRISKDAIKDGIDFLHVGKSFIDAYHKNQKVLAVKIVFITLKDFPYFELEKQVSKAEKITEALSKILNNIKMDCSTCNLKPVCDEVEELRTMHKKENAHA